MRRHGRVHKGWALALSSATVLASLVLGAAPAHADEDPNVFGFYDDDPIWKQMWDSLTFATVGSMEMLGPDFDCVAPDGSGGYLTEGYDELTGAYEFCQPVKLGWATPNNTGSLTGMMGRTATSTAVSTASGVTVMGSTSQAGLALNTGSALRANMFGLMGESLLVVDPDTTDLPTQGGSPAGWANFSGYFSYVNGSYKYDFQFDTSGNYSCIKLGTSSSSAALAKVDRFYANGTSYGSSVSVMSASGCGTSWTAMTPFTWPALPSGGYAILKNATFNTELSRYYDPGNPEYPPGTSGFVDGTMDFEIECIGGGGITVQTQTVNLITSGTVVPRMSCGDGQVMGGYGGTFNPSGGGDPVEVFSGTNPEWVTDIPTEYPGCLPGGAECGLTLWQVQSGSPALYCGNAAVGCPQWWQTVQTAPSAYECRYGTYAVDLSYCAMFRNPGSLAPTVPVTRDAAGNVQIGTRVGTVTDADYAQLDRQLRDLEELVRVAQANPQPDPENPNPAPTNPPVPPPVPNVTEARNCWPTGWGIFNPFEWVYLPVTCALEWAFVPSGEVVAEQVALGRAALDEHGVLSVVPAALDVPAQVSAGWSGACTGGLLSVSVPVQGGAFEGGLPCAPSEFGEGFGTSYGTFYTFLTVVIVAGGAWGLFILVRSHFGGRDA